MSMFPVSTRPRSQHGLIIQGPMAPVGGFVELSGAVTGFDPSLYATLVIQADDAYSVEILGPSRVWTPYPGSTGVLANQITIVRGRWLGVRVVTSGNVWLQADRKSDAWAGVY